MRSSRRWNASEEARWLSVLLARYIGSRLASGGPDYAPSPQHKAFTVAVYEGGGMFYYLILSSLNFSSALAA